jgi:hypothetical protein
MSNTSEKPRSTINPANTRPLAHPQLPVVVECGHALHPVTVQLNQLPQDHCCWQIQEASFNAYMDTPRKSSAYWVVQLLLA